MTTAFPSQSVITQCKGLLSQIALGPAGQWVTRSQAASVRSHSVQVLLSKIALKLGGHWSSRGCRLVNQTAFVSTLYPSSLAIVTFDCRHSGLKFTASRGQFRSKAEYRLR